jgi:hypothetical protein
MRNNPPRRKEGGKEGRMSRQEGWTTRTKRKEHANMRREGSKGKGEGRTKKKYTHRKRGPK